MSIETPSPETPARDDPRAFPQIAELERKLDTLREQAAGIAKAFRRAAPLISPEELERRNAKWLAEQRAKLP